MPRRSAAALAVVPLNPPRPPEPPKELTREQAKIWREIAASRPADWFRPGDALLVAFCRHTITARTVALLIDEFDQALLATPEGLRRYGQLLTMAERESKALAMLGSKLRITQVSTQTVENARTAQGRQFSSGRAPWQAIT